MNTEKEETIKALIHAIEHEYHSVCDKLTASADIQLDDLVRYCLQHNQPLALFMADSGYVLDCARIENLEKALEHLLFFAASGSDDLLRQNMKAALEMIILAGRVTFNNNINIRHVFERKLFPKWEEHLDTLDTEAVKLLMACIEEINQEFIQELPNEIKELEKDERHPPLYKLFKLNNAMNSLQGVVTTPVDILMYRQPDI